MDSVTVFSISSVALSAATVAFVEINRWNKVRASPSVGDQYKLKVNEDQEDRWAEVVDVEPGGVVLYRRLDWDEPMGRMRNSQFQAAYELVVDL